MQRHFILVIFITLASKATGQPNSIHNDVRSKRLSQVSGTPSQSSDFGAGDEDKATPIDHCEVGAALVKSCACKTAEDAFKAVAPIIEGNIAALNQTKTQLSLQWEQLGSAIADAGKAADGFEIQVVSRCTIAALEAVSVSKSVTSFKALCSEGTFVAQCASAGISTTEIMKYVSSNQAVQAAVLQIATQSANIIAKQKQSATPGWMKHIPIVGSVCNAYDYSNKVFNSPEIIDELGRQQSNITKLQRSIDKLIREQKRALATAQKERNEKCK